MILSSYFLWKDQKYRSKCENFDENKFTDEPIFTEYDVEERLEKSFVKILVESCKL